MNVEEISSRTGLNLHICAKSSKELFDIYPGHAWEENQLRVLVSNTISFYRLSLQYMFVSEYCNLLEPLSNRYPKSNISSMYQLNRIALKTIPDFKDRYDENIRLIEEIINNDLSKEIKRMRDKQLVHSDAEIDEPGKFKGINLEAMESGFMLLRVMRRVLHSCNGGIVNIPEVDSQTQRFIRNHAVLFENPRLLIKEHIQPFFPHARNPY
jgi:hypothetical protein